VRKKEDILCEITPSSKEKKKVKKVAEDIISKLKKEINNIQGIDEIEPRLVGSTARGTWISGDRDIDIFMMFPKDLDRDTFRSKGLELARRVGEYADSYREEFAEHPYVTARFDEFDVDIVPCYNISRPDEITSAVDRTPLHDNYITRKLNSRLKDSVRLLKYFMKGIGVYGAEFKIGGFSGYITELLTIYYDGFEEVIDSATSWRWGETIDVEEQETSKNFKDPLIVIDPVDPNRNVAAALTEEKWATFISASRYYSEYPIDRFFNPCNIKNLSPGQINKEMDRRETYFLIVEFDRPPVVDDTLYPQLYKTENWLKKELENNNFSILRSNVSTEVEKKASIIIEMEIGRLPLVKKHIGPPVESRRHSKKFVDKYLNKETFSGPYIEKSRWMVEKNRDYTSAHQLVKDKLSNSSQSGVGKDLSDNEYKVMKPDEIPIEKYRKTLSKHLRRTPPWMR